MRPEQLEGYDAFGGDMGGGRERQEENDRHTRRRCQGVARFEHVSDFHKCKRVYVINLTTHIQGHVKCPGLLASTNMIVCIYMDAHVHNIWTKAIHQSIYKWTKHKLSVHPASIHVLYMQT